MSRWDALNPSSSSSSSSYNARRRRQRQSQQHGQSSNHDQSFSSQRTTMATTSTTRSSSSLEQQGKQNHYQQQKWRRNDNKLTTTATQSISLPEQQKKRQMWQRWRDSCRKLHLAFQRLDDATNTTVPMDIVGVFIKDCRDLLLSSSDNETMTKDEMMIEIRFVDTSLDLALECLHRCYQIMIEGSSTNTGSRIVVNDDNNKRTVDIIISENDLLYRICHLITQFSQQLPTTNSSTPQLPSDVRLTNGLSTLTSLLLNTNSSSNPVLLLSTLSTIFYYYTPQIYPNTLSDMISSIYIPAMATHPLIACQTLGYLFCRHRSQACAILSPLVYDVSDDGLEWKECDVLGGRIARSLMNLVRFDDGEEEDEVLREACVALTGFLMIDDDEVREGGEEEVVLVIQRIVSFLMMEDHGLGQHQGRRLLLCPVLKLLSRLMTSYPRVMISHWNSLLPTAGTTTHHNTLDDKVTLSDRLIFYWYPLSSSLSLSPSDDTLIMIAAIEATEALLKVLPLRLWLGTSTTGGRQRSNITASTMKDGHLNHRVRTSLIRLINLSTHYFSQTTTSAIKDKDTSRRLASLCQFISTLFRTLPFDDKNSSTDNDLSLTTPAIPLIHLLCSLEHSHQSIQSALLTAIGGQMTPSSESKIPSIPPLTYYLETTEGRDFLERLFMDSINNCCSEKKTSQLLWRRLSKCHSWIYAHREERFIQWINEATGSSSSVEMMADLVYDWLDGNKHSSTMTTAVVVVNRPLLIQSIAPRLLQLVNDSDDHPTLQSHGLYSFALLEGRDWDVIATTENKHYAVMDYFNTFLHYCGDGNDAIVRRAACKSVAEFGTLVVGADNSSWRKNVVGRICREISESMKNVVENDNQAAVRGMALFAMGNLAMALVSLRQNDGDGNGIDKLLPQECFRDLVDCSCHSLNDKDDKVITNAIRTMGHLANLSQHQPQTYPLYNTTTYNTILRRLSHFITTSLSYTTTTATTTTPSTIFCSIINKQQRKPSTLLNPLHLTSKKRVHLKKHAWGSCRSLSHLLNCRDDAAATITTITDPSTTTVTLPDDKNNDSSVVVVTIKNVLRLFIQCLEMYNVLHEKIWMEAMNALLNVTEGTWRLGEERQRNGGSENYDDEMVWNKKGNDDDNRGQYDEGSLLGQCITVALVVCNGVSRNNHHRSRLQHQQNNNSNRQRQSSSFFSKNSRHHHRGGGNNVNNHNKSQPTTTTHIAVVQQQVNELLMRLLQFVSSWKDFKSLLLYESSHFDDDGGGGEVLEFFYLWLVDRSGSSTSTTKTATGKTFVVSHVFSFIHHAMRRWEERSDDNRCSDEGEIRTTAKEMDVRLYQKFASRALREERMKKQTNIGGVNNDGGDIGGGLGDVDVGMMDCAGFRRSSSSVVDYCSDGEDVLAGESMGGDIIVLTADGYYNDNGNGDDEL